MKFFKVFEKGSGQVINYEKCSYIVHHSISKRNKKTIEHLTSFKQKIIPLKYMGCPIFYGRPKHAYFDDLIQRIKSKIEGWQSKFLSFPGRRTLINSVLASIPIHAIYVLIPPLKTLNYIKSFFSNFLWGSSIEFGKRHHWISWDKLCYPI